MLSNKMTFSLTCLVMLLAFGLACFVPSVMADGDAKKTHIDLEVTIGAAESLMDVSAKDGLQVGSGRNRMDRRLDLDGDGTIGTITADNADPPVVTITEENDDILTLSVRFSHPVNLENPGASLEDLEQATLERTEEDPDLPTTADSGGNFGTDDIFVAAFDIDGRQLGVLPLVETGVIEADFIDASSPGRNFLVTIHQGSLLNAYDNNFEISELVFFIPIGRSGTTDKLLGTGEDAKVTRGIRKADFDHVISHFGPDAHQHLNKASNRYEIELVDADQGDPQYAEIMGISGAADVAMDGNDDTDTDADGTLDEGSGTPGVVSIMRTASRAGFIESGDFEVRIILTEEPMGGLTADKIMVTNGVAKSVVKGVTYRGGHPVIAAAPDADVPVNARPKRDSELGPEMIDYYLAAVNAGVDPPVTADFGTAPVENTAGAAKVPMGDTADNGTVPNFPGATGRDNMYHSYIAMISPSGDVDGNVIVSVGTFDDNVLPVPNRYIPVTPEQRDATRLSGWAEHVRDARVMNETLSVRVVTGADTTSDKGKATVGYAAHDTVFEGITNEKVLDKGLVIPGNGYLVLVADAVKAGVQASDAKIKGKVSAASKLYNTTSLGLPFPADNLDGFFRNGGSLSVVHLDIPDATGSGHDDAKASEVGDDYTGYTGAATKAYAAGDVIISEIMWGQDSGTADSQYIELHNTTETDIGIDNKEWAIVVGAAPSGFTVLDTVNNRSATGFWAVPGSGGATKVSQEYPSIIDLVSMSRVTDTTDGSAEASWAMSMRPSANIAGRRIGTPGAANSYVEPTMEEEMEEDTTEPMAPAATAGDIMITEIMVASDGGRLPQWIELKNVSMAAASLTGWSLEVENDPVDTDVVDSEVRIDLGDTEIGAGQVALVVTKESNRNSGVGDGDGDLRRIIDVQSQVSPDSARYSLLSEMAFMISLRPPQTGTVKVGNLGKGWDLPMSEGDRSSLIRREMSATAEIMGTDAAGWMLASDTMLDGAYTTTYYGDADDMGTPGYDAGGALPVELSKFGAKRDPLTDQVIITWETQSELNNAGFNIKRSQQKTSQFVVVNPTLIAGAGTTSEKQSYTYTDTAAQPNIVYYYQIEDVSFDGNRQTLTRAHRLKGHGGCRWETHHTLGRTQGTGIVVSHRLLVKDRKDCVAIRTDNH